MTYPFLLLDIFTVAHLCLTTKGDSLPNLDRLLPLTSPQTPVSEPVRLAPVPAWRKVNVIPLETNHLPDHLTMCPCAVSLRRKLLWFDLSYSELPLLWASDLFCEIQRNYLCSSGSKLCASSTSQSGSCALLCFCLCLRERREGTTQSWSLLLASPVLV